MWRKWRQRIHLWTKHTPLYIPGKDVVLPRLSPSAAPSAEHAALAADATLAAHSDPADLGLPGTGAACYGEASGGGGDDDAAW